MPHKQGLMHLARRVWSTRPRSRPGAAGQQQHQEHCRRAGDAQQRVSPVAGLLVEQAFEKGLEVPAYACRILDRVLDNVVDQAVNAVGVKGGLAHKQLVQDDA